MKINKCKCGGTAVLKTNKTGMTIQCEDCNSSYSGFSLKSTDIEEKMIKRWNEMTPIIVSEGVTHKIETIQDILNATDDTNYKAFMIDFTEIVRQMAKLKKVHNDKPMLMQSFDWIDDGNHNTKTSVNYPNGTLEIIGEEEPNKSEWTLVSDRMPSYTPNELNQYLVCNDGLYEVCEVAFDEVEERLYFRSSNYMEVYAEKYKLIQ